jgi:hypothetical protein
MLINVSHPNKEVDQIESFSYHEVSRLKFYNLHEPIYTSKQFPFEFVLTIFELRNCETAGNHQSILQDRV